jgi:hypothetical protein
VRCRGWSELYCRVSQSSDMWYSHQLKIFIYSTFLLKHTKTRSSIMAFSLLWKVWIYKTWTLVACSRSIECWMTTDIGGNYQRWKGHYTRSSKCARRKGIIGINKLKDWLAGSTYSKRITRNFHISWWESRVEHLCSTSKTTKWQKGQNSLACWPKTL